MASSQLYALQQLLMLTASLVSFCSGVQRLAVKPRNTAALAGDRVTLRCGTDSSNNDNIQWSFESRHPSCRPRRDHCNLVIDGVQPTDAGGYDCAVEGAKIAQASLIVIDAFPVCEADVYPVVAGTSNNITCRLNYTRFTAISPGATMTSLVTWPDDESGYFRSVAAEPHRTGWLTATVVDVPVTEEGIAAINWTVQFVFDVRSAYKDFAVNNDSWSWMSDVIPVSSCPTSVFITTASAAYRPGSVLTCGSNGHPQPNYTWTDATSGRLVATGRNVTLADRQFRLTCTATAQLKESCSASLTVDNLPASTSENSASSSNELLMMVLVIVLGGLLCLTLVIVVVLAAIVHVLRKRKAQQKPDPAVPVADDRADSSYAGLQGYQPQETTSPVYTPMNHVDPAREQDSSRRRRGVESGYAGLNRAPTIPPPRPDTNTPDYLTLIG